ncbi:MAG: ABC transporter ATP-binding protein [Chloroflexota bacterium]
MTEQPLLSVRHLTTEFHTADKHIARALEDVSFDVLPGQTLGLVGESGCGKTTVLMSIMRLLPASGRITAGHVYFKGNDLLNLSEREMRAHRWKDIAIVFQGAMNALNPVMKVGDQIREAILLHNLMDAEAADKCVGDLLEMVGIQRARRDQYPHQYSGGMRQRAMIAMALACSPSLLFADEPTTALDVMIQAQVLQLLNEIQKSLGLAIVMVTHDLGVVAEVCDSVVVMYGGKVAEYGPAEAIYNRPQHPYTQRLLASFPDLNEPSGSLASIPGTPPRLTDLPTGCRFHPRCHAKVEVCDKVAPPLRVISDQSPALSNVEGSVISNQSMSGKHYAACHLLQGEEAKIK